jgi:hypothetical protein
LRWRTDCSPILNRHSRAPVGAGALSRAVLQAILSSGRKRRVENSGIKEDDLKMKRAQVDRHAAKRQWDMIVPLIDDLYDLYKHDWALIHIFAVACYLTGGYPKALALSNLAVQLKINNYTIDIHILCLLRNDKAKDVIPFFIRNKVFFKPKEQAADTILANLICVYSQPEKLKDVERELSPFITDCYGIKTNPGLNYNLACLYAQLNDADTALQYAAVSLELGYDKRCFHEKDFDTIKENEFFIFLLNMGWSKRLWQGVYRQWEEAGKVNYKEIVIRDMTMYQYSGINDPFTQTKEEIEYDTKYAALKEYYTKLREVQTKGKDALSAVEKSFVKEINDFCWIIHQKQIAKEITEPVGAIILEWDYGNEETMNYQMSIETYQTLEEAREKYASYCYADDSITDTYFEEYKIYSPDSFQIIINQVVQTEGYQALIKKDIFFFSHQEHDSGNEFCTEVTTSS